MDVGHGQMDYRLRRDPRVVVMEKVNARPPLLPERRGVGRRGRGGPGHGGRGLHIPDQGPCPRSALHLKPGGPLIALVKPQFEAEKGEVGRGGVVKDPKVHARVLGRMVLWGVEEGFRLGGIVPSPILGDAGNREFFVLMRR